MDILGIEVERQNQGLSIRQLCSVADISDRQYFRVLHQPNGAHAGTLAALRFSLSRFSGHHSDMAITEIRAAYLALHVCLILVCDHQKYDLANAVRQDPARRATSDPQWLEAARARALALYLANGGLGLRQSVLARCCSLTKQAVSLALTRAEQMAEDNPGLEDWLDRTINAFSGLGAEE